jgi:hypothetical protein
LAETVTGHAVYRLEANDGRDQKPPRLKPGCYVHRECMEQQSKDITLRVAKLAAAFCSLVAAAYAATQAEPSPAVALFLSGGPLFAVVLWLQKDARRTRVGVVQDWGYFLLLAWPVVIPWYAFKTRGRSGWRLTAGLFGLVMAPYVSWLVVASVVWYFDAGTFDAGP